MGRVLAWLLLCLLLFSACTPASAPADPPEAIPGVEELTEE